MLLKDTEEISEGGIHKDPRTLSPSSLAPPYLGAEARSRDFNHPVKKRDRSHAPFSPLTSRLRIIQ